MPAEAPLVVLLRSPDEGAEDRYVRALAEEGFRAVCRPVLRFAFAGDDDFAGDDLQTALRHPGRYGGLVLTSPRAARALTEALPRLHGQGATAWGTKPVFAVGPKTAAVLRDGGLEPQGASSGGAEPLADAIAAAMSNAGATPEERPLLFLCGNRRRDALPRRLRAAAVPFEESVVYETHLRAGPWLQPEPSGGAWPAWAVFFSPSGLEAVQQAREAGWRNVRKAAIGSTTAGALRAAGWTPDAVAPAPTPKALAGVLRTSQEEASSGR